MSSSVCYASLAIYAKHDREAEIVDLLGSAPSLAGERRGTFSCIYSTRDVLEHASVEEHVQYLQEKFSDSTQALTRLSDEGCEIRVWIYFGVAQVNRAFVLQDGFIKWLSLFNADVCVDAWVELES
ncbi:DUF4279 domain-containing protein [Pseudoxanthomonas koreensis]|uniref:DUF4279 domain-containing protein n=1 Tax=Pseudoxanthomonas koreensis TaxID=266061 RepID=UPI00139171DA|nr:DUF4279 domain-containing protein [Pseudoxanthomonas koreensis]